MKSFLITLILGVFSVTADAAVVQFDVFASANSSTGGIGVNTGLSYSIGDSITGFVDPNDLWNAGALPRWSNADGLIADLFATGTDDSGQPAGTLIGTIFSEHTQDGLTAPFNTLVGEIGNSFFVLGTNFDIPARATGILSLYFWDSNSGDNTEFVTASIGTVPIPATAWLFGSALGLLSWIRRKAT